MFMRNMTNPGNMLSDELNEIKEGIPAVLEKGIQGSENISNAGTGFILGGFIVANPTAVLIGKGLDMAGSIGTVLFKGLKAANSGESEDIKDFAVSASYEGISLVTTSVVADKAKDIIKKADGSIVKELYNSSLRKMSDKSVGAFSKKVIESGKTFLAKAADFIGDTVFNEVKDETDGNEND